MSFIKLFRIQFRYLDPPTYKGPYEYKKRHVFMKKPFGVNLRESFELFEDVRRIRMMEIKEPSPFHLVWRYKQFGRTPWTEKIILRRLGLHMLDINKRIILPNTPHYNNLLWQVKHLIRLKPVSFPDGIPTEKDIGATKVHHGTGAMTISESYRIPDERLEAAKLPDIYYGRYLREYLKYISGIFFRNIASNEVLHVDGNDIDSYHKKLLNANKHQHEFYAKK